MDMNKTLSQGNFGKFSFMKKTDVFNSLVVLPGFCRRLILKPRDEDQVCKTAPRAGWILLIILFLLFLNLVFIFHFIVVK